MKGVTVGDSARYVPNELLSQLVGDRLAAVTFVLNSYLQLQFDDARMNVENCPQVITADGRVWHEPDLGYADQLRRMCDRVVTATSEKSGDGLRIFFEGEQIHINPTRDEVYVEIATLHLLPPPELGELGEWMCWLVGGETFEHLA